MSFSQAEFKGKKRVTRREKFLGEMERVVPWEALTSLIEPYYPKGERGRPPIGLERMLRIYFLQQWYALADEALEDALYDSQSMRQFAGIDLGREDAPDATTLLKFRRLLERHDLTKAIFARVNQRLLAKGLMAQQGTIVDATILHAPSSTKNASGQRDPEMHQTRKGNQWYFGMKAHVGADLKTGAVHSLATTPAHIADITQAAKLLHGKEQAVIGDSAYLGLAKRPEIPERLRPHILASLRPSMMRRRSASPWEQRVLSALQHHISSLRARGEHAFGVLKHIFGWRKVRYRGLHKNTCQLHTLFALVNLYLLRKPLLAQP